MLRNLDNKCALEQEQENCDTVEGNKVNNKYMVWGVKKFPWQNLMVLVNGLFAALEMIK